MHTAKLGTTKEMIYAKLKEAQRMLKQLNWAAFFSKEARNSYSRGIHHDPFPMISTVIQPLFF